MAYVEYFESNLLKRLRIESSGKTVSKIENEKIIGSHEVEAEVSKENLYSYKVELAKPNYLVLVMAAPDALKRTGKHVHAKRLSSLTSTILKFAISAMP